jgi:hypothetical protein
MEVMVRGPFAYQASRIGCGRRKGEVRGEERPGKSEEPEALQRDESSRQVGGESSQRELRRERGA